MKPSRSKVVVLGLSLSLIIVLRQPTRVTAEALQRITGDGVWHSQIFSGVEHGFTVQLDKALDGSFSGTLTVSGLTVLSGSHARLEGWSDVGAVFGDILDWSTSATVGSFRGGAL